jgi:hypothetical protein
MGADFEHSPGEALAEFIAMPAGDLFRNGGKAVHGARSRDRAASNQAGGRTKARRKPASTQHPPRPPESSLPKENGNESLTASLLLASAAGL